MCTVSKMGILHLLLILFILYPLVCFAFEITNISNDQPWHPCPFNEYCQCLNSKANCTPGPIFRAFKALEVHMYELETLILNHDTVHQLGPNYFSAFKKITSLKLIQPSNQCGFWKFAQDWDEQVFNGVQIDELEIEGVDYVIGSPALNQLRSLKSLSIKTTNSIDRIHSQSFRDFEHLRRQKNQASKIARIDADAFYGLDSLEELDLSGVNITYIDSPFSHNMKYLNLGGTRLKAFDLACLSTADGNVTVDLSNNPNLEFVIVGKSSPSEEPFPEDATIILRNTGLKTLLDGMRILIQHHPSIKLDLSDNDFKYTSDLLWLVPNAFCSNTVNITGTKCAGDPSGELTLDAYFREMQPNQTCEETAVTRSMNLETPPPSEMMVDPLYADYCSASQLPPS